MSNLEITLTGNVGTNPILSKSNTGDDTRDYTYFRLATSTGYRTGDGTWKNTDTQWFTCKAWGQLARNICCSVKRGNALLVRGKLTTSQFEIDDEKNSRRIEREILTINLNSVGLDLNRHTVLITNVSAKNTNIREEDEEDLKNSQDVTFEQKEDGQEDTQANSLELLEETKSADKILVPF